MQTIISYWHEDADGSWTCDETHYPGPGTAHAAWQDVVVEITQRGRRGELAHASWYNYVSRTLAATHSQWPEIEQVHVQDYGRS